MKKNGIDYDKLAMLLREYGAMVAWCKVSHSQHQK